jgi:membrane peptidoglycan carboxypeptidase
MPLTYSLPGKIIRDRLPGETTSYLQAVSLSPNAPFYWMADTLNPKLIASYWRYFNEKPKPWTSILHGCQGISEENRLQLYNTVLVHKGVRKEFRYFNSYKIRDESKHYFNNWSEGVFEERIFDSSACSITKKLLQSVLSGTAYGIDKLEYIKKNEVYLKTGTSQRGVHQGITGSINNYTFTLFLELRDKTSIKPKYLLAELIKNLFENGFIPYKHMMSKL